MEINKYTDIIGGVAQVDIPEGRMVVMVANAITATSGWTKGSRTDLPGFQLPANGTQAQVAKYVATWPVNNAVVEGPIKMFIPQPSIEWSLRQGGWDRYPSGNVPFTATVYLTSPEHQEGVTIPRGFLLLAFDKGVFTVPSGHFVYSANLVPGAGLEALNTTDDTLAQSGKLNYATSNLVAVVERYDATENKLTFRTL
jgi:hypothetical protein